MPKTLYDEDGNPQEIETPEEVKAKLEAEYQTKLKEAEDKVKNLEEDPNQNLNFKELRQARRIAEEKAEGYKKELEKLGHNPEAGKAFTREEAEKLAEQKANEAILNREKNRAFSQYDAETRPVVENYFNKITAGETLDPDNIADFVQKAEMLAKPGNNMTPLKRALGAAGGPPRTERSKFTDTDRGQELAGKLNIDLKK